MGHVNSVLEEAVKREGRDLRVAHTKIKKNEAESLVERLHSRVGPTLHLLEVVDCRLKSFPANLARFANLLRLEISHNLLETVPDDLSGFRHLKDLDLRYNAFTKFPSSVLKIVTLTRLDLSHNALHDLPFTKGALPKLETLCAAHNQMTAFPIQVTYLPRVKHVDLSYNRMMLMADEVDQMKYLETLDLRGNQLDSLTTSIGKLHKLKTLDVSHNKLSKLPAEVSTLIMLQHLNASHNTIGEIPPAVCQLGALRTLRWSNNGLRQVPPQIEQLDKLEELYVHENGLQSIPKEVAALSSLRRLFAEYNEIDSIPDTLSRLPRLVEVQLHHNALKRLPSSFVDHAWLLVGIDFNPLEDASIVSRMQQEIGEAVGASSGGGASNSRDSASENSTTVGETKKKRRATYRLSIRSLTGSAPPKVDDDSSDQSGMSYSLADISEVERVQAMTPRLRSESSGVGVAGVGKKESSFDVIYGSIIKQQDYSDARQHVLTASGKEKQWRIVGMHRAHTIPLLLQRDASGTAGGGARDSDNRGRARTSSLTSAVTGGGKTAMSATASDFIRMLRVPSQPKKLDLLKDLLSVAQRPPTGFLLRFVERGGIAALVEFFFVNIYSELVDYENLRKTVHAELSVLLDVLQALCDVAARAIVLEADAVNIVALCLKGASFDKAFTLFNALSAVNTAVAFDALRYYQRTFGSPFRFTVLISPFSCGSLVAKVEALAMLARFVAEERDLEARFDLRNEIMRAGLSEVMGSEADTLHTTPELEETITAFEIAADDDYHGMIEMLGEDAVMAKLETFMSEHDDIADNIIRIAVYQGTELHGTVAVPYVPETRGRDIIDRVLTKYPMESEDEDVNNYGLLLHYQYRSRSNLWMDDEKTAAHYGLLGEIRGEFKMKPWSVHISFQGEQSKHKFAPTTPCKQIVAELFETLTLPAQEVPQDYGMYGEGSKKDGNGGGGRWFDGDQPLIAYAADVRRKRVVQLRRKPKPVRVKMQGDAVSKEFYFEEESTIDEIIAVLVTSLGEHMPAKERAAVVWSDYALYLETEAKSKGASDVPSGVVSLCGVSETQVVCELKPGTKFSDYVSQFTDSSSLRFKLRPHKFDVHVPSEVLQAEVALDLMVPVSQVILEICSALELPSQNEYKAFAKRKKRRMVALDKDQSLHEQSVKHNTGVQIILRTEAESGADNEDDVNIWDEPTDDTTIKYDKDGTTILSATFNQIVKSLTSTQSYDRELLDVFLLTYRAFATPDQLVRKLAQRWRAPGDTPEDEMTRVRLRIGVFIKNWIAGESRLGWRASIRDKITEFVKEQVMASGAEYETLGSGLLRTLEETPLGRQQRLPSVTHPAPKPLAIETNISSSSMNLLNLDEEVVAEQLTWYMWGIYEQLEHTEFFNAGWIKKTAERTSPNVLRMIDYFNYVSAWVSSLLVTERLLKNRAKLAEKFIKIAFALRKLNNFHLLVAFITGLNNSGVSRLKHTFARVPKKVMQLKSSVEALMSMESSFTVYRKELDAIDRPCIPYIGVALTDLTFVEEGNPNKIDNQIYFVKQKFVYNIIETITRFQATPYEGIQAVDTLRQFLNKLPIMDEKEIYAESLKIEPRGADAKSIK